MPSYSGSFYQLEAYFSGIEASTPANSAQANWTAGAVEARQLAAELRKNLSELQHHWTGPASTEYSKAMNAIIEYAEGLADDMTEMGTGLASMATTAATIKPQALAIINAARGHSYTRAAAIAPLNGLLSQLGGSYQNNRSSHWREPKEPPQQLPKAGGESQTGGQKTEVPADVRPAPILGDLDDIGKFLHLASSAYEAFSSEKFPSGVTGDFPTGDFPVGDYPINPGPGGGGGGETSPGGGPMPSPDDPDYQPLPEPEPELTESPVHLAGATPTGLAGTPAVSLGAPGGSGMGAPGGAMPMGMGMGMGAAGAAGGGAKPSASPGGRSGGGMGGGMMGPGMAGARGGGGGSNDEGKRTWLTEDELVFDADDAPSGVVGHNG